LKALSLSDEEKRWDEAMAVWHRARQFQRRANAIARAAEVSFAGFQVLEVAERLTRHREEPVSELEVARGAQLAKSTVSVLMRGLMEQGFVDIGPDAWGVCYRIWLTKEGKRRVEQLRGKLLDVAAALLG
jgi:DNA-binding MarR family transcriptional regulator